MKTSQSRGENDEGTENPPHTRAENIGSPTTAGEKAETTGGDEQEVIATPSKIVFETIAYASMWPRNLSNTEESKDWARIEWVFFLGMKLYVPISKNYILGLGA